MARYTPQYMMDSNYYYARQFKGKIHKRMTFAQVKAYIKYNGSWRGFVKGKQYNDFYNDPINVSFESVDSFVKYVNEWNYYNRQDYGTMCFWHNPNDNEESQ